MKDNMHIRRFIAVLDSNKHLLGEVNPEHWSYEACERPIMGCPLRVVAGAELSPLAIRRGLYTGGGKFACNPHAEEASQLLNVDIRFALGVQSGWDSGVCYLDSPCREDNLREFAGFLVSTVHKPAVLTLPQG